MKKVLISCLEPSANLHLAQILPYLKECEILGIFDEKFGEPLYKSSEFSTMGFASVLPLVFKAKRAIKEMTELAKQCDAVLLIDSPAFNLPLAKAIKAANVGAKVVYYILPKVWAWQAGRVKVLEQNCDELASILPFDDRYFTRSTYVGNPLLDEIKYQKTSTQKNGIVAFLPGSRRGEITRLMPIFRQFKDEISAKKLLVVPPFLLENINEIYGDTSGFEIVSDTPKALYESDFAFICSGTATLEAALIGTPFVLAYKAKAIDIFIAKLLVKLRYVGLANIMFDYMNEPVLNIELIQNEVTKQNLLKAYNEASADKFIKASKRLREYLAHGSSKNVAKILKGE